MEGYLFKASSLVAKIFQFVLLGCAILTGLGGLIAFSFRDEVLTGVKDISPSLTRTNFYPVLAITFSIAIVVLVCLSLVMKQVQLVLTNLSRKDYFSKANASASLKVALLNLFALIIQLLGNVIFRLLTLDNTSQIFNIPIYFYLLIMLIAFVAYVIFKQGRLAQEDSESII